MSIQHRVSHFLIFSLQYINRARSNQQENNSTFSKVSALKFLSKLLLPFPANSTNFRLANKHFKRSSFNHCVAYSCERSLYAEIVSDTGDCAEALRTETENLNISRRTTGSRSPAGPRRLGTATRISASLFRRLSAFFGSTPDQAPKAAKLAVLIPGPGMLVNVRNAPRVVIPPPSETPPVSACKPLCAILLRKPSVYPLSLAKTNVGRL